MMSLRQLLLIPVALLLASLLPSIFPSRIPADDNPPEKWNEDVATLQSRFAQRSKPTARVVFIGSSTIRRWDLKTAFPELDAVNHGFGGSYLSDSVHFFERLVQPAKPEIIVLYAGDNDLNDGKTPETVLQDFQAFLTKVDHSLPMCRKVFFLSIKPSIKRWKNREKILRTNQLIRALCEQHPRADFVEFWKAGLDPSGQPRKELLDTDDLHLNDAGYQVWTQILSPLLNTE